MKVTAIICTLMAAAAVNASFVETRDTCGSGFGVDQRRTNSPCKPGNGDRHFCGCDRTGVVQCKGGRWTEIQNCHQGSCHGGSQGGAKC